MQETDVVFQVLVGVSFPLEHDAQILLSLGVLQVVQLKQLEEILLRKMPGSTREDFCHLPTHDFILNII